MNNIKLVIIFLFVTSSQLFAQEDSTVSKLSGYVKNINTFTHFYPQEKVYLHFDNTDYFLGEHIWFKAYVVTATQHLPTHMSRVLYVELLNPEGDVVETKKLKIEAGQCHGDFLLKDSLLAGYYELRAYTRYMLNFGNTAFISNPLMTNQKNDYQESSPVAYGDYWMFPNGLDRKNMARLNRLARNEMVAASDLNIRSVSQASMRNLYLDIWEKKYYENEPTFSRVFAIYDKPTNEGLYNRKSMTQREQQFRNRVKLASPPSVYVSFYPEGGNLVEGLSSKIAFKAVNEKGENIQVSGIVKNENGETVSTLASTFQGMGIFTLLPNTNNNLAEISYRDSVYKMPLPTVEKTGYVVTVNTQFANRLLIDIQKSPNLASEKLGLSIICRGKVCFYDTLTLANDSNYLKPISRELLPTGVNQLTLFDAQGKVLSERLIFINHNDFKNIDLAASIENKALQAYAPIQVNLKLQDSLKNPIESTFSLTIRDMETLEATNHSDNILTNLLLSSDLKGYILNPAYFFESNDNQHKFNADLLMLTQGWRRYAWRELAGVDAFTFRHPLEKGIVIDGTISEVFSDDRRIVEANLNADASTTNDVQTGMEGLKQKAQTATEIVKASTGVSSTTANNNNESNNMNYKHSRNSFITNNYYDKLPKAKLNINLHGGPEKQFGEIDTQANDDGYFTGFAGDIEGTWELTMIAQKENEKEITLENFAASKIDDYLISLNRYFSPTFKQAYSFYETNNTDIANTDKKSDKIKQTYRDSIAHSLKLDEFTVKAKKLRRKKFDKSQQSFKFSVKDEIDFLQDYIYITEDYDPEVRQAELDKIIKFACYRRGFSNAVVASIRDLPYTTARENWYTWSDMDSISIYTDLATRERYAAKSDLINANIPDIVVIIQSFSNNQSSQYQKGIRRAKIQGYSYLTEFYQPDYSNKELPEKPDFRRTLYWNPCVKTDSTGTARIEFYNNSSCKELDISAEGITKNGEPIVNTKLNLAE